MKSAFLVLAVAGVLGIFYGVHGPQEDAKAAGYNPATDIVTIGDIPLNMLGSVVINEQFLTTGTSGLHQTKFLAFAVPGVNPLAILDAQAWYQVQHHDEIQDEIFRISINDVPVHEENRRAEMKGMSYHLRRAPVVVLPGQTLRLEWIAVVGQPAPSVVSNFSFASIPPNQFN